jgi:hypothetical protein
MTSHAPRSTAPAAGGLDMKTLLLTAASSAAAAYVCSRLWAPGTLAAAAFTPVLVALIKEALSKSTEAVTRAVPVKGVVRSARPQGPQPPETPAADATVVRQLPADAAPPAERVAQPGEVQYHAPRRMRGWRLAVVTGLAGFLICAVVFTVPELLAGGAASGGGRETTIFGGKERDREPAVIETTTAPTTTVVVPPAKTVTVPAPTTTTQTVTQPPAETTTTPPPTTTPEDPAVTEPSEPQPPG